mgnify:CR=1 FL=1|tara:strand:+ start:145 stop:420 length:276 start_codon:yes stop_codon:yes gene_type:complete
MARKRSKPTKINKASMPCNKPKRQVSGGKKFVVKACQNGQEKIIRFGDANMTIKKSQPARKKSYCARSGGIKGKTNKLSANYWSRKAWGCK